MGKLCQETKALPGFPSQSDKSVEPAVNLFENTPPEIHALVRMTGDASLARELLAQLRDGAATSAGNAIDDLDAGAFFAALDRADDLAAQAASKQDLLERGVTEARCRFPDRKEIPAADAALDRLEEDRAEAAEWFAAATDLGAVQASTYERVALDEVLKSRREDVPPVLQTAADAQTFAEDPSFSDATKAEEIEMLCDTLDSDERDFVLERVGQVASLELLDAIFVVNFPGASPDWLDPRIDELTNGLALYAEGLCEWSADNFLYYASRTGGSFYIDWSEGQAWNVITNLVGAAIGVAFPVLGLAVSTLAGALASAVSSYETEAAVNSAMKGIGDASLAEARNLRDQRDGAREKAEAEGAQLKRDARGVSADAGTKAGLIAEQVESSLARLNTFPVQKDDLSLAESMLADWVRQRAGTESVENDDTLGAAWQEQRKAMGGLEGENALFTHQTRYEWSKLGYTSNMAAVEEELQGKSAEETMSAYDGKRYSFGEPKAAAIDYLVDTVDVRNPQRMRLVLEDTHTLMCVLDLKKVRGTVYVDQWEWLATYQPYDPDYDEQVARFWSSPD